MSTAFLESLAKPADVMALGFYRGWKPCVSIYGNRVDIHLHDPAGGIIASCVMMTAEPLPPDVVTRITGRQLDIWAREYGWLGKEQS